MLEVTAQEKNAVIGIVTAIADTIRDLPRGIPSGELYAMCMSASPKLTIDVYNAIITFLVRERFVDNSSHYLTWIGPR